MWVHSCQEHTYVTLLTTRSDAFYDLKDSRARIQNVMLKSNVLTEVQRSLHESALHVEDLPIDPSSQSASQPQSSRDMSSQSLSSEMAIGGPAGLWHFIYKSVYLDQYVSSEFPSSISNRKQQKRLYEAYQKFYASMHDKATGPHKTQFRRDEDYVLFCWITQDFELYAAFNPLADKTQAIKMCNRVCQWVRDLENEIFVYGESALSWWYIVLCVSWYVYVMSFIESFDDWCTCTGTGSTIIVGEVNEGLGVSVFDIFSEEVSFFFFGLWIGIFFFFFIYGCVLYADSVM